MVVTILVNPVTFKMKMANLKGKYPNISNVVADIVPIAESFDGKNLVYAYELTNEQFENMK